MYMIVYGINNYITPEASWSNCQCWFLVALPIFATYRPQKRRSCISCPRPIPSIPHQLTQPICPVKRVWIPGHQLSFYRSDPLVSHGNSGPYEAHSSWHLIWLLSVHTPASWGTKLYTSTTLPTRMVFVYFFRDQLDMGWILHCTWHERTMHFFLLPFLGFILVDILKYLPGSPRRVVTHLWVSGHLWTPTRRCYTIGF